MLQVLHKQQGQAPFTLTLLILPHPSPSSSQSRAGAGAGDWSLRAGGVASQPGPAPARRSSRAPTPCPGGAVKRPKRAARRIASLAPRQDRRDVPCPGGGRQDGVRGELRGPRAGRNPLRAVPSGTGGGEGAAAGAGRAKPEAPPRGGAYLDLWEPRPLPPGLRRGCARLPGSGRERVTVGAPPRPRPRAVTGLRPE